jgi:hypothetical protein
VKSVSFVIGGTFSAEITKVFTQQYKGSLESKANVFLSVIRVTVILGVASEHGTTIICPINAVCPSRVLPSPIVGVPLQFVRHSRDINQPFLVFLSPEPEDERTLRGGLAYLWFTNSKAEKVVLNTWRSTAICH